MRIGIIAALPGELKPLVKRWQKVPVNKESGVAMWRTTRGADELIAACAGMGAAAAGRAFAAAEFTGSLDMVLSLGWAGALTNDAAPGHAYAGEFEVIDAQTGERFTSESADQTPARIVSTVGVASEQEKLRLAASYDALLVDMESATVARLAKMRGIPMYCFKGVSDGVHACLPDLNPFIDISGKLAMGKFLAHVALRPKYWRSLEHLRQNSLKTAEMMAAEVNAFLERKEFADLEGEMEL